ncbi:MAG: VWA domain-containing protein [Planctomycetota bacterium]|jgi:Mg-chelatase subunit ChlD
MFEFSHPWLFVLLPLPLVLWRLLPSHRESRTAVSVPFMERLARLTGREPAPGAAVATGPLLQRVLLALTWIGLVAALARPQWIEDPIEKIVPTRDLLLAVDLSGSMEVEDFKDASGESVDRLTAVKQVLDDFLTRRKGDRVGLIFFGSAAFVQAPFTEDLDVCRTLLDEAQVRMAGPQTMLGDAIGLAINVFEQSETEERVLIVLTDGNDTGSKVPPDRAAAIAKDKGITIHAVAVGDPEAAGEEKLDEETLAAMTSATGGAYLHAVDREALAKSYERLDEIGTREKETISHRPRRDLFHWLLAIIIAPWILYHALKLLAGWRKETVSSRSTALAGGAIAACLGFLAALGLWFPKPGDFHFLRPEWLWLLPLLALIAWWIFRKQDETRAWRGIIADHLLKHLLHAKTGQRRFRPLHLWSIVFLLCVISVSGPTWSREPSPFAEDRAALFIAVKVSPSMKAQDIQPSRFERARHKIKDLLALRQGALAGLIAYSGSAHLVMPLTRDSNIITSFAGDLEPKIMPREGDAAAEAVGLAAERLAEANLSGSILLIADGIAADQIEVLRAQRDGRFPVHVLAVTVGEDEGLKQAASLLGGTLTRVTPDERDVERIASNCERSLAAAVEPEGGERWKDFGYLLLPLIAFLCLVWFRPGWLVTYS